MASLKEKYPETYDCHKLGIQLQLLRNEIAHYYSSLNPGKAKEIEKFMYAKEAYFVAAGCAVVLENKLQSQTKEIFDKFSSEAEQLINTDSKHTRNILVFVAAATIIGATAILLINRKGDGSR